MKEAIKFDSGKVNWSLVPFEALEGMVRVLEFGAKKYAAHNWRSGGGFSYTRLIGSTLRHLFAWSSGQDNDPETNLSHIHHAQCNLLFLSMYLLNKKTFNKDDRYNDSVPSGSEPATPSYRAASYYKTID